MAEINVSFSATTVKIYSHFKLGSDLLLFYAFYRLPFKFDVSAESDFKSKYSSVYLTLAHLKYNRIALKNYKNPEGLARCSPGPLFLGPSTSAQSLRSKRLFL
jgi:hypothetical protein